MTARFAWHRGGSTRRELLGELAAGEMSKGLVAQPIGDLVPTLPSTRCKEAWHACVAALIEVRRLPDPAKPAPKKTPAKKTPKAPKAQTPPQAQHRPSEQNGTVVDTGVVAAVS